MQRPNPETVMLNDILITEELPRRAPRSPNWQAEAEATRILIHQTARDSESLMQTLVDTALELCQAGTTGLSLLETTPDGEEIFRWTVLAGTLAHRVGGTTPRNFSPCGVCLEQGSPVLFSHPERYFTYFQAANTPIVEGLVLPLMTDNHILGTIWIMSHDEGRQFDSEDVRVMTSLADFTATALLLQQHQTGELLAANAVLETEIVERKHVEKQTHALISSLPGGAVFVVDRNLRYLLAEGEALAIAGFKPEDFVGRTLFEVLPPELAASYEPMYRQALAGESFEHEHDAHDHTYISRGTPLRAETGEVYAVLVVSYDITDRKQAEQALRESEARLQPIANLVPDLLWDSEPDGSTNWYNQRWMEYTGQTFEQAIGWGWIDAIHPDDREGSVRRYREVVEQGMPLQQEHRIRRHDGAYRWFVVKASPLKDERGKVIKMYGAATDIHERWVALEALRESEARFRTLADTAPALIWHNDAQGNNRFINQHFLDFTGKSAEEIRGEGWQELVHPDDAEAYIADYLAAVHEQRPWHNRCRIRRHDRVWRWHDNYAQPLFSGDGVYLGHVGVTIDNTDAIAAEVALRESEAKYRSLFETMDEGLSVLELIYDDSGKPIDMRWVEANPAFEKITGLKNVAGRLCSEFVPSEDYWLETYDRVVKTGESMRYENYHAGIQQWYRTHTSRMGGPGSRVVANIFEDITERKLHERQQEFLLQLSDALRPISDPIAIQETASRMAAEHLDIGRVAYCEIRYEPDIVVIVEHDWPRREIPSIAAGRYRMSDFGSFLAEEFAAGRPAIITDVATDPRISQPDRENWSVFGIRASCGLPVIKEGRFVAYLVAQDNQPHAWTDREIELLRELSERTWAAVERARAEAALRDSEQRLSVIFAQAAVGLSEISLDGHFEQVNDALCRMLGRSRQELLAATVPEVTHPEDVPKSLDALAQLLETGESIALDKRYLRPDGTVLWANSILTRLNGEQGQPHRILAVTLDMSARQQAEAERLQRMQEQAAREEERQRAESLAELDRAKTSFFSNISHEFRTPLTLSLAPLQDALKIVDEWMSNGVDENPSTPLLIHPSILKHNLELVHRNNLRLLKLVNTLLDFSRIEAGRMEAVYEPTDLATFTTELTSVFRSAIERAGLQLIVDCPPLPEAVYVDREMWEKIVLNLLSNAFKFTFKGEIRVSLYSTNCNQAILQVQDTGVGIAPEHLPHLFERFYQVRGTQARTHDGSGIGLALVHELVRLQGGTIEVTSTLGEGTCFTIALPFGTDHLPSDRLHFEGDRYPVRTLTSTAIGATAYVEEAERWLPEKAEGRGQKAEGQTALLPSASCPLPANARVLVADDNADMREYLTRILSEHVQVEAVVDGATALTVAQERVPDLILSDVMMPGLDGFELLESLRADPRTREIPIILLSARAGEEAIVEGLEAGADDYLIKPFSAQELVSRVTTHLQMAQQRGAALQQERVMNRQKDEFISVVSHELNTPLVSILGWTRVLRSSPPNPVMLSKALDTIERNAMLQSKLVQDLLDLSRIAAGKLRLNSQPIELKPVIETAIATVTQPATDKGINLTWQENGTEPVVVMGDSDRLSQVLINLLANAIKFTPESGSVTLELSVKGGGVDEWMSGRVDEWMSAGVDEPPSTHPPIHPYAEIRVIDTGDGISASFLPHVFDRFRQAEGAHSAKGLGLGLAIARHIVELHNGTIHAESAGEGQGATFTVRLPLLH